MNLTFAVLAMGAFGVAGTSKVTGAPDTRETADHLGFSPGEFRFIGLIELIGVLGVTAGLFITGIGVASAITLLLLMAGAVASHLICGDGLRGVLLPTLAATVLTGYLITLS
ncbi:DoxX family protein [Actinoplanes sp. NPDC023936]|uniref:DoxX family protein n=1 Tax=Actinoplanes sp. NPDC023936 TaxID=3154910 RepID=UPI0033DB7617